MKKKHFGITSLVIMMMVCLLSFSAWAVPALINYNGKLTNADGNILNGNYQISFYFYDGETGGTAIWGEQQTVTIADGIYNIQLGAVEPFPLGLFDNDWLYFEMSILNPETGLYETLAPRQRLTSTAFAMRAGDADTIGGIAPEEMEESLEINDKINAHALDADVHHTKTTRFSELTDMATDAQIPNDITIAHSATAGKADTVDGKHANEFLDTSLNTQNKSGGLIIGSNLGIGITPNAFCKLHVNGDSVIEGDEYVKGNLIVEGDQILLKDLRMNGFLYTSLIMPGSILSIQGSINVAGDILYTGGILDVSDLNLKENIAPLENALEKISFINGIYFNNIGESPEKREVGVIAQEVETVLPEVVLKNDEGYKSVDYSKLTPLLIEAVKELKAENEKLKLGFENQTVELQRQNEELRLLIGQLLERIELLESKI